MGFLEQIKKSNSITPVGENPTNRKKGRIVTYLEKESEAFSEASFYKKNSETEESTLIESIDSDAWVYACIYKLAASAASVPFKIYNINDDKSLTDITYNPEFSVFQNPNPWFTRYDFFESTVVYLESVARAFWEVVKDKDGKIIELYPLKPSLMTPIKDRKKFIKGWEYKVPTGKPVHFEVDQIIYLKYYHPDNPYIGLSPLRSGANSVAMDIFSQQYAMSFFKNSGRPDGLLIYDSELTDEDYDRIRLNWDKSHKGISQAHRVAIIEQGMDYKSISTTQKDAEFVQQRKMARDEILACFGVPPACVGVFESAIKANAEVQERMFWTETMIPKLMKLSECIKLSLIPIINSSKELSEKYDVNKIVTTFDTSNVHVLMSHLREQLPTLNESVKNGVISRNEFRQILNNMYGHIIRFNDFEGGNSIYLPANVTNKIGVVKTPESEINELTLIDIELDESGLDESGLDESTLETENKDA